MQTLKLVIIILIVHCIVSFTNAQILNKNDTMDTYDKKLNDYLELVGQNRLDIDGFMFYSNTDSVPQDIFLIPFPLNTYDNDKSLEDNFMKALSKSDLYALEEVFMSIRWTMPTLLDELKKCSHLVVDSDYPPAFEGWPLRVIYGRLVYSTQKPPLIPPPMVAAIRIKYKMREHEIPIRPSGYGYAKLFKCLK